MDRTNLPATSTAPDDRAGRDAHGDPAQAYTLEGVVGALLLLTALLFTTQSLVITPTTGGAIDGAGRGEIEGQVRDVLATSAADGSLSRTARYWNNSTVERTFAGGVRPDVGYGNATPPTPLGERLDARFLDRGYRVNVELAYLVGTEPAEWATLRVIYHGVPTEDAVAVSVPLTLYDDEELTGPRTANETIAEASRSGAFPVPDVAPNGSLHNTASVRVVVW